MIDTMPLEIKKEIYLFKDVESGKIAIGTPYCFLSDLKGEVK